MSNDVQFPAPFRHNGRLVWDKFEWENYKRGVLGLAPLERDPAATIIFISAKQLEADLPVGRRQIGRYVKGRIRELSPARAEAAA